jgi:hypothetical protein
LKNIEALDFPPKFLELTKHPALLLSLQLEPEFVKFLRRPGIKESIPPGYIGC